MCDVQTKDMSPALRYMWHTLSLPEIHILQSVLQLFPT